MRWRIAASQLGLIASVLIVFPEPVASIQERVQEATTSPPSSTTSTPNKDEPPDQNSDVNFSDWSAVRIKAYRSASTVYFPLEIAVLSIPRLKLRARLFEGTDDLTLDRGLGRIAGTALPGEAGNLGVAGHRDGFFRPLKDIRVGDTIDVATSNEHDTYSVKQIEIVDPGNTTVLKSGVLKSSTSRSLTLVTCYPFYFAGHAPRRFIVEASLVRSTPIQ
jgi:sortase A